MYPFEEGLMFTLVNRYALYYKGKTMFLQNGKSQSLSDRVVEGWAISLTTMGDGSFIRNGEYERNGKVSLNVGVINTLWTPWQYLISVSL